MAIQMIKLVNGETLIGDVKSTTDGEITIVDPLQLDFNEEEEGYAMIAFLWIPLTLEKTDIILNKDHVITAVDAQRGLGRYYRRSLAFLTGNIKAIQDIITEEEVHEMKKKQNKLMRQKRDDNVIPLHTVRVSANTVH